MNLIYFMPTKVILLIKKTGDDMSLHSPGSYIALKLIIYSYINLYHIFCDDVLSHINNLQIFQVSIVKAFLTL